MRKVARYRVLYGESLGSTVQRILDGDAARRGRVGLSAHTSENPITEYGEVGDYGGPGERVRPALHPWIGPHLVPSAR